MCHRPHFLSLSFFSPLSLLPLLSAPCFLYSVVLSMRTGGLQGSCRGESVGMARGAAATGAVLLLLLGALAAAVQPPYPEGTPRSLHEVRR